MQSGIRLMIETLLESYIVFWKAWIIELMLSYPPVIIPNIPKKRMKESLIITVFVSFSSAWYVTISNSGGIIRANVVLLTAPTRDMNSPRNGIASARITVKKLWQYKIGLKIIRKIEKLHDIFHMFQNRWQQFH